MKYFHFHPTGKTNMRENVYSQLEFAFVYYTFHLQIGQENKYIKGIEGTQNSKMFSL